MVDELDRGLLHALRVDGRAPFSRIGAVLGVSTQTVARRYRRLRAEAGLRVVGLASPDRSGQTQWLVRLTTTPSAGRTLATALAQRSDTSWVKLTSGGTEILVMVHAPTAAPAAQSLLLRDIPRAASITAVSAHYLLHTYRGGPTAWPGHAASLTAEQQGQLRRTHGTAEVTAGPGGLTAADDQLIAALHRDGRASLTDLAAATGWSAATVARRLTDLRATGTIFFDVELDDAVLGVTTQALLWMAVAPARLAEVAAALSSHDELAFVAATTGPTNLVAQAMCPDPAALHRYLTHRLGGLDAIHTLETAPVLATVKSASPLPLGG